MALFQFKMNAFVRKTIAQKPQVVPTQQGRDTEDHVATYSCLPYAKRLKKCRIRIRVQGWSPVISSAKMSLYRRSTWSDDYVPANLEPFNFIVVRTRGVGLAQGYSARIMMLPFQNSLTWIHPLQYHFTLF